MKSFFQQYSYSIIKMFVNQFAISIFGTMLAMATIASGNNVLTVIASIFAVLFYLFLIYTLVWEVGAKDRISVDVGKKPRRLHLGLVMACIAGIPSFVYALFFTITQSWAATHSWIGGTNLILTIILEGMYMGINSVVKIGEATINTFWFTHFLTIIPALLTSWLAYFVGFKGFRFFAFLTDHKSEQGKQK